MSPLATPVQDGLVWYVSYGSNMAAERFACYLVGGRPPGGSRTNPGARDRTPPRRDAPVDLPGSLYFAGESPQWGGGVAFYDHHTPGPTHARGYLITLGQLVDVATQEMYLDPAVNGAEPHPLEALLTTNWDGAPHALGPGRYETLVAVGELDGAPRLTFTSPTELHTRDRTLPAPAYLAMLASGLRESRGWDDVRSTAYLDAAGARRLPRPATAGPDSPGEG